MIGESDLELCLQRVLEVSPGLSARTLARAIRERFGFEVHKGDINPILYRRRHLFEFDGYSPPLWSLVATATARVGQPSSRTHPVPEPLEWKRVPTREIISAPRAPRRPIASTSESRRLYEWQREAIAAWQRSGGRGIVEAVTGTGKSRVATEILREMIEQGLSALILVPSLALQSQWADVIGSELQISTASFIGGGHVFDAGAREAVTIGLVNSVAPGAESLDGLFDVIVADECHRYGAATFRRGLLPKARWRLGLTATLDRSDDGVEQVLLPYFGRVCYRYGYREARRDGVIAPYGVVALGVDLHRDERDEFESAGMTMSKAQRELIERFGFPPSPHGEFLNEVNRAQAVRSRVGFLARAYLSALQTRKRILAESREKLKATGALGPVINSASHALVFTETIRGARLVADRLSADVDVDVYDSKQPSDHQRRVLRRLGEGGLRCAVAVRALDEGIDVPHIDLGIIVSASKSRRQMIQRMGRVVRRKTDGRGAVFMVIYASETAEDPFRDQREGAHLEELLEHADRSDVFHAASLDPKRLAAQVAAWIRSDRTDSGGAAS